MASMRGADEMRALMTDLCTPAELEALVDRWCVVPLLLEGIPYREIHDRTAVSVTTIGRVARCLAMGEGGYQMAAERMNRRSPSKNSAVATLVKPRSARIGSKGKGTSK